MPKYTVRLALEWYQGVKSKGLAQGLLGHRNDSTIEMNCYFSPHKSLAGLMSAVISKGAACTYWRP